MRWLRWAVPSGLSLRGLGTFGRHKSAFSSYCRPLVTVVFVDIQASPPTLPGPASFCPSAPLIPSILARESTPSHKVTPSLAAIHSLTLACFSLQSKAKRTHKKRQENNSARMTTRSPTPLLYPRVFSSSPCGAARHSKLSHLASNRIPSILSPCPR